MPSRLALSPRTFCALLFLAVFLSLARVPVLAQESASDRAGSLRGHLSDVQKAYGEAIDRSSSEAAAVRLERLRLELRTKLGALFTKATSSEATLAVYRADAEATLDAVRAYEKSLGAGTGEETTFWNVIPADDLERLRGVAESRLNALKAERINMPPEHVPPSLEFRIREVEGWREGLKAEAARRAGSGQMQVRLKSVNDAMTADEARAKYPAVGRADGQGGARENFQRKLGLQVSMRQHNAPGDAALASLRDALPNITPPSTSEAPTRGPPASVESARDQLRAMHFDELNAVTRRDQVAAAQSRAKAATTREWLRLSLNERVAADKLGLSEAPTEHLLNLRDSWQQWHDRLVVERQTLSATASVDLQLKEAQSRIRDIDRVIEYSLLPRPPDGGGDFGSGPALDPSAPPTGPPGPEARAFARSWDRHVAHNEMTELAKVRNSYQSIPNFEAGEAASKAFRTRVSAEAKSIRAAYDETVQLQRRLLISGRGPEASESGKQLQQGRKLLRSAAQEFRDSLADPAFRNDPEVARIVNSLSDIPPPGAATESDSFARGLTALERARAGVESAAKPADIQIHSITEGELSPSPAYRIRLVGAPPAVESSPVIRRPADYTKLYPKGARPPTIPEMLKDPKRAPGGVIVEAKLPAALSSRLDGLEVDVNSGTVKVSLNGKWRRLSLRPDPLLARIAWAFVLDEQTAVIDLRPLEDEEALWLLRYYGGGKHLLPSEREEVVQRLTRLTSVNVNDALRDTPLVPQLIAADELMFDLLPRSALAHEGEDDRYGLPLKQLREAFRADAAGKLRQSNWQDVLFNKSILAVSKVEYEDGPELVISPQFSFNLFGVPARGNDILRLSASERWFAEHERELSRLPQLSRLSDFAELVALFRAAEERRAPHNLDDLIAVPIPAADAPRFIVRRKRIGEMEWQQLRDSLPGRQQ